MSKEIETIKAEINTLYKGIETYRGMVSDKLDSLVKRLDDLTVKEKPASEIKQDDWMWIPEDEEGYYIIHDTLRVCLLIGFSSNINRNLRSYNIFKTKELAESRKHLSPLQRKWAFILDYLGRNEDYTSFKHETIAYRKFFPVYDCECHRVKTWVIHTVQSFHKSQYATSEEMCKKAIEIMGDDIYPYLGVDKP